MSNILHRTVLNNKEHAFCMISLNLLQLLIFSVYARGSQTFKQHCIYIGGGGGGGNNHYWSMFYKIILFQSFYIKL